MKAVYGVLEQVGSVQRAHPEVIHHDDIALSISKTLVWAHLGLSSTGQTKQTMVGSKVVYGMLEQVGSV